MALNILVLEPYLGGSRKNFINGLSTHSIHNVIPLTMSDRHKKWRIMGSGITMADYANELHEKIDVILASNTTNLSAFIALSNPKFAKTPIVLYMHENELTEPNAKSFTKDINYSYINYISTLIADQVVFSSEYHLRTFFEALPQFLATFPDYKPKDGIERIKEKSSVIHPGMFLKQIDPHEDTRKSNVRPIILWNQRWTEDKDPAKFFRMMNRLDDAGFQFDLILAGDNRHDKPIEFERAWSRYGNRIIHYGFVEDLSTYCKLLHKADIVVSTSKYEFFSVAIMEAIYAGCHPVLPKDLTYPELLPKSIHSPLLHAETLYNDEDHLFKILKSLLSGENKPLPKSSLQNVNKHLDWSQNCYKFDLLFEKVKKSKN